MNEIVEPVERLLEDEFGIAVAHKRLHLPAFASEIAYLRETALQGVGFYSQQIHVLSEMNKTIACSIARAAKEPGYDPKITLKRACADRSAGASSTGRQSRDSEEASFPRGREPPMHADERGCFPSALIGGSKL